MISAAFAEAEMPDATQRLLLVILGLFLPPLPIFMLTGPRYTIWTKEFFIALFLTLFPFFFVGFLYTLYFVCVLFPQSRGIVNGEGYERIPEDLELATPAAVDAPLIEVMEPELPSYEESEGPSAAREEPRDVKSNGDNKVQL